MRANTFSLLVIAGAVLGMSGCRGGGGDGMASRLWPWGGSKNSSLATAPKSPFDKPSAGQTPNATATSAPNVTYPGAATSYTQQQPYPQTNYPAAQIGASTTPTTGLGAATAGLTKPTTSVTAGVGSTAPQSGPYGNIYGNSSPAGATGVPGQTSSLGSSYSGAPAAGVPSSPSPAAYDWNNGTRSAAGAGNDYRTADARGGVSTGASTGNSTPDASRYNTGSRFDAAPSSGTPGSYGAPTSTTGTSSAPWSNQSAPPGQSVFDPSRQNYQPSQNGYEPGKSSFQPGNTGYQPGATNYQPANSSFQPGNTGYQPGTGGYQSSNSTYQPGNNGYSPPGYNGYQSPGSSSSTPSAGRKDPSYRPGTTSDYIPGSSAPTSTNRPTGPVSSAAGVMPAAATAQSPTTGPTTPQDPNAAPPAGGSLFSGSSGYGDATRKTQLPVNVPTSNGYGGAPSYTSSNSGSYGSTSSSGYPSTGYSSSNNANGYGTGSSYGGYGNSTTPGYGSAYGSPSAYGNGPSYGASTSFGGSMTR